MHLNTFVLMRLLCVLSDCCMHCHVNLQQAEREDSA